MKINIRLSVNDKNISKLEIKKMLLDALFNISLENTIEYQKVNHETNNQVIIKIKRDNE